MGGSISAMRGAMGGSIDLLRDEVSVLICDVGRLTLEVELLVMKEGWLRSQHSKLVEQKDRSMKRRSGLDEEIRMKNAALAALAERKAAGLLDEKVADYNKKLRALNRSHQGKLRFIMAQYRRARLGEHAIARRFMEQLREKERPDIKGWKAWQRLLDDESPEVRTQLALKGLRASELQIMRRVCTLSSKAIHSRRLDKLRQCRIAMIRTLYTINRRSVEDWEAASEILVFLFGAGKGISLELRRRFDNSSMTLANHL